MPNVKDGPCISTFVPLLLKGNVGLSKLASAGISDEMAAALEHAPRGACVCWGIPFQVEDVVAIRDHIVSIKFSPTVAQWLVFMHTSDLRQVEPGRGGFISPTCSTT